MLIETMFFADEIFQSTPPVWAETGQMRIPMLDMVISIHSARVGGDAVSAIFGIKGDEISIHSARVGGDALALMFSCPAQDFNPLRPCGRRLGDKLNQAPPYPNFNPLRPCGRRPPDEWYGLHRDYFNPLRPCGRRLDSKLAMSYDKPFQSTPPVWAETLQTMMETSPFPISIHSARVGGDVIFPFY